MATATKKTPTYPIHELSLSAIKVDHSLQSRVETSVEYMREYSEAMLRGDVFPPVKVIKDEKGKHWLYDGFHRYGATKKCGKQSIRAEVREGTKEDAYVLSAGANREFSIKRTAQDIKKACYMLFALPEWWAKATSVIATHVGTSFTVVQRHRAEYSATHGVAIPDKVELPNGRMRRSSHATFHAVMSGKKMPALTMGASGYEACLAGKTIRLGRDRAKAEAKLKAEVEAIRTAREPEKYSLPAMRLNKFASDGLCFVLDRNCLVGHGCIACIIEQNTIASLYESIGRLVVVRAALGIEAHMVLIGYAYDIGANAATDAEVAGIPIMEPSAFVVFVKSLPATPN